MFGYMTDIYIDLIGKAKEQGELSAKLDACETANSLVALMQGMSIMGNTGRGILTVGLRTVGITQSSGVRGLLLLRARVWAGRGSMLVI